jgi:hypothetical protein
VIDLILQETAFPGTAEMYRDDPNAKIGLHALEMLRYRKREFEDAANERKIVPSGCHLVANKRLDFRTS